MGIVIMNNHCLEAVFDSLLLGSVWLILALIKSLYSFFLF